tara:strand:- start:96 stop:698 length:603 start_codon:yes stop_codon:yes gene_type:complete
MWFDILKVQQGSFSTLIPKNLPKRRKRTNCLDELKSHEQKLQAKVRELENNWKVDNTANFDYQFDPNHYLSDEIDEGLACKILEVLNDVEFKDASYADLKFSYNGKNWLVHARYKEWVNDWGPIGKAEFSQQTGIELQILPDYSKEQQENDPFPPTLQNKILDFGITLYVDDDDEHNERDDDEWAETWEDWKVNESWKWF